MKQCIGSILKVDMCTKAENGVLHKGIITFLKRVLMHTCMQCSLYKPQSTWKCAHVDQPNVLPS